MDEENSIGSHFDSHPLSRVVAPGLALIPGVGGMLAAGYTDWATNRRMRRIEDTLRKLGEELQTLRDWNPDVLTDPDFGLLEAMLVRAKDEHREEKRRMFAALVASEWKNPSEDSAAEHESYLKALDEFGTAHIEVLRFLREQTEPVTYAQLRKVVGSDARLVGVLDDLCTRFEFVTRSWTLGRRSGVAQAFSTQNLSPEGIARGCRHKITAQGGHFLEAITPAAS